MSKPGGSCVNELVKIPAQLRTELSRKRGSLIEFTRCGSIAGFGRGRMGDVLHSLVSHTHMPFFLSAARPALTVLPWPCVY